MFAQGAAKVDDYVYVPEEVTQKAKILSKPQPKFTEEARKNDADGVVRLRLVLAASAKVTDVSVVEGLPYGLTEKAVRAARKIKFTPATKDGHLVSQYMNAEYNFTVWFDAREVSRLAAITYSPTPEITEEARKNRVQGSVLLLVGMSRRGEVVIDKVVKGLPYGLTEKAIAAARQIKFTPAIKDGRSVSVFQTIEFKFSLR
jgi:TonB family protein